MKSHKDPRSSSLLIRIFTVLDPADAHRIYDFPPEVINQISSSRFPSKNEGREWKRRSIRQEVNVEERSRGQKRNERESGYHCLQKNAVTRLPADQQQPRWQNSNPRSRLKDAFVDTGKGYHYHYQYHTTTTATTFGPCTLQVITI